ncbi:helix-turn-helix domain-containing protein [Aminobacter anthyllidis]|uniref:helix-turn-helix transcriptional regulator n=1 Tax=Aminobacter anthyllidis TaxID=1035067 RepID=UPI002457F348|nr:helix-turn-helix domain-containing protein [Aminobacter anthyllidis]MDH4986208.1 helix-turn-helix domain-containing protein [Aminobacter anthyllidis]
MALISTHTRVVADEWLSTKEVARLTKLSVSFFEQARIRGRDGGPPWHKIGGSVRYRLSEVLAWLESCRVTGGACHA